jgi:hypothetical protein
MAPLGEKSPNLVALNVHCCKQFNLSSKKMTTSDGRSIQTKVAILIGIILKQTFSRNSHPRIQNRIQAQLCLHKIPLQLLSNRRKAIPRQKKSNGCVSRLPDFLGITYQNGEIYTK